MGQLCRGLLECLWQLELRVRQGQVSDMNVTLIAIDLAKSTFQVCGVNRQGKEIFNRATSRKKLTALIAQYLGIPVAMEACGGSNYWGRTFQKNGH
jgi:transposase